MEKMKAVLYNKKGSPEKLSLVETDKPVAKDHEVLIRVHAVSFKAAEAMNYLSQGHASGKVIISVEPKQTPHHENNQ